MYLSGQEKQYRVIRVTSDEYRFRYVGGKPGRIIRVCGCEFHLFNYLEDGDPQEYLDLPQFYEYPEYTADGRPFASMGQEPCSFSKPRDPEDLNIFECCECKYFIQDDPPDIIGVCMCDERRREPPPLSLLPERIETLLDKKMEEIK